MWDEFIVAEGDTEEAGNVSMREDWAFPFVNRKETKVNIKIISSRVIVNSLSFTKIV
jgi:hypothetical protein